MIPEEVKISLIYFCYSLFVIFTPAALATMVQRRKLEVVHFHALLAFYYCLMMGIPIWMLNKLTVETGLLIIIAAFLINVFSFVSEMRAELERIRIKLESLQKGE